MRRGLVESLAALFNSALYPCVPAKGSVGASGDLAPLAHLSQVLIGEGEVRFDGQVLPAAEGLARAGLAPLQLGPKEGLALLNGTQVSTALALAGLCACESVFAAALVAGALSVDAAQGSDAPFSAAVQEVRGQPGQIAVAATLRELLAGSAIRASHLTCDRVQDPYSLRCQPQVMGANLDLMAFAAGVLGRESNAVTDNPLVFRSRPAKSCRAATSTPSPVAQAADLLALVLAETGTMSERRVQLLTNAAMSGLPAFLIPEPGLDFRLHGGADRRRGTGRREQGPGPSRQHRQPADDGRPGGPRQHGDPCRPAASARWRGTRRPSSPSNCSPRRRE